MGSAIVLADFNGDGLQDVAVTEAGESRVLIYFGRRYLDPKDSTLLVPSDPNGGAYEARGEVEISCSSCARPGGNSANFGFSLAAGDVAGDGAPDLIIGAPDDGSPAGSGRVFVVEGELISASRKIRRDIDVSPRGTSAIPPMTHQIEAGGFRANHAHLGYAVAAGVDPNGIGILAISSHDLDGAALPPFGRGPRRAGAVHVMRGPIDTDVVDVLGDPNARHIAGDAARDSLGDSLAFCDVDGSGYGQGLVIGAVGVNNARRGDAGALYVVPGQRLNDLLGTSSSSVVQAHAAGATILGANKTDSLGYRVACGDVDHDGMGDVLASAYLARTGVTKKLGAEFRGKVYVFHGASPFQSRDLAVNPGAADLTIVGPTNRDQLGSSLAAGDADGDGVDDIVIGASQYTSQPATDPNRLNVGITYVVRGGASWPSGSVLDLGPRISDFPIAGEDPNVQCVPGPVDNPACAVMAVMIGKTKSAHTGSAVAIGDFLGAGRTVLAIGARGDASGGGRLFLAGLRDNDEDGVRDLSDQDDDNDCLADTEEDVDGDGIVDQGETNPLVSDTDLDGLQDGTETGVPSNNPPMLRGEFFYDDQTPTHSCVGNSIAAPLCCLDRDNGHTTTDPLKRDTDGDCLPDGCDKDLGPCPPTNSTLPVFQGEDVNLNGAVDGLILTMPGASSASPEIGTETDPGKVDSDGDGLSDGLEWGLNRGSCGTDLDPNTWTDPRDADSDDGGVKDGDEDVNHNGRLDFDPNNFTCNVSRTSDVNNETDPGRRSDDARSTAQLAFTDSRFVVLNSYLQNDELYVMVDDANANQDPNAVEHIVLSAASALGPTNAFVNQGLACLSDDPNKAMAALDQESVTLTETGLDTHIFRGALPMSSTPGGPLDGVLSCTNNGQVRLAYRDPGDLCDQRTAVADVSLARIRSVVPTLGSLTNAPVTSLEVDFTQDLDCTGTTPANIDVTGSAGNHLTGTLTCDMDPNQSQFGSRRMRLDFFQPPLPDDVYTATIDCEHPNPIPDVRGFSADCENPCVVKVGGRPNYCSSGIAISGDGDAGGAFVYTFGIDNSLPTVQPFSPMVGPPVNPAPGTVVVQFSEAMDADTITQATFTVSSTVGSASCASPSYEPVTKRASCRLTGLGVPPDDLYTVTLKGSGTAPIADLAGNALNGGTDKSYSFVVNEDDSPTVTATDPNDRQVITATRPGLDKVAVTFSEAMDPSTITGATFKVAGTMMSVTSSSVPYNPATKTAVFMASGVLPDDLYTVTLLGSGGVVIKDLAQDPLDGDANGAAGGNFTSSFLVDYDQVPSVTGVFLPADPNGVIAFQFDQAMDRSTVENSANWTVAGTMMAVTASVISYDPVNRKVTFGPSAPLPDDKYTVTLRGMKDHAGHLLDGNNDGIAGGDFVATFLVDAIKVPTVQPFSPMVGPPVNPAPGTVVVQFSEAMDANTITLSTFMVSSTVGSASCVSPSYEPVTKRASCTLTGLGVPPDDLYTVTLKGDSATPIKDLAGNALNGGSDTSYTFLVNEDDSPTVTATDPNDRQVITATRPGLNQVGVTFSEAMDPSTITGATFKLAGTMMSLTPSSVTYAPATRRALFVVAPLVLPDDLYTVTLLGTGGTVIKDLAQDSLDGDANGVAGGNFISTFVVDYDQVPSVTGVLSPVGGKTADPNTLITFRFDQSMAAATVENPANWTVVGTMMAVTASQISYNPTSKTVTFQPSGPLPDDSYTVKMIGMTDHAGNFLDGDNNGTTGGDFVTTFLVDAFKTPTVQPLSPTAGTLITLAPTAVTVRFSEAMDATTITQATFTVSSTVGGVSCVTPSYDQITKQVTCTLMGLGSPPDDMYTVTLKGSGAAPIKDMAGNALNGGTDTAYSFIVDTDNSPNVASVDPANGFIDPSATTTVSVVFREAMNPATINNSTFFVTGTAGPITPSSNSTYDPANKQATLLFALGLRNDIYTVHLTGTGLAPIKDLAGHALDGNNDDVAGGDFASTFAVAGVLPRVQSVSPPCGSVLYSSQATVDITFTQPMNTSRFNSSNVQVIEERASTTVRSATLTIVSPTHVIIRPSSLLQPATNDRAFRIQLGGLNSSTDLLDQHGNLLSGAFTGSLPSGDGITPGDFECVLSPLAVGDAADPNNTDPSSPSLLNPYNNQVLVASTLPGGRIDISMTNRVRNLPPGSFKVVGSANGDMCASLQTRSTACPSCGVRCVVGTTVFADDKYTATLKGDVSDPTQSISFDDPNEVLDGEFGGRLPSGNGATGGDFQYNFFVDVDQLPQVVSTTPSPGSIVTTDPNAVIVVFDQEMDPSTIDRTTVTLTGNAVGPVGGSVAWDPSTNSVTFTPDFPLPDDIYHINLLADPNGLAVRDFSYPAGNALDGEFPCTNSPCGGLISGNGTSGGNFDATFTVDLSQGNLGPRLTGMTPAPNSTAPKPTAIIWTFDRPMDPTTLVVANVSIVRQSNAMSIVCNQLVPSSGNAVLTCNVSGGMPPDTYTITLASPGIKDTIGKPLNGEFLGSFPSGNGGSGGSFVVSFTSH